MEHDDFLERRTSGKAALSRGKKNPLAITQELLRKLFTLNEATGELTWKEHQVKSISAKLKGKIAGDPGPDGRIRIKINGKWYGRSHLVYLYTYGGCLPSAVLQKDGDLTNDRPENLRPVTMYPDTEITQEYLRKVFHLNNQTGELFRWIEVQGHLTLENRPAGSVGDKRLLTMVQPGTFLASTRKRIIFNLV